MSSLSSVDIETRERERTSLGIFINFHQYVVEDLVSFLWMLKLSFPGFRRYLHTILKKNGNGLESSTALRADHQTYETEILTLLNFSGEKKETERSVAPLTSLAPTFLTGRIIEKWVSHSWKGHPKRPGFRLVRSTSTPTCLTIYSRLSNRWNNPLLEGLIRKRILFSSPTLSRHSSFTIQVRIFFTFIIADKMHRPVVQLHNFMVPSFVILAVF